MRKKGRPGLRVIENRWPPKRIEELRMKTGLSQRQFSFKVGITPITYYGWMTGAHIPSPLSQNALDVVEEEFNK